MELSASHGRTSRKIQRRTQSSHGNNRYQSEDIPHDLVIEILSRLSAKSIARCRLVSKLWSSIITRSDFINSFETRSSASRSPCTMLIFRKIDKLLVFYSPLPNQDDPYPKVEKCQFTIPNNVYLQRHDSVHGLICLETTTWLMIWNPTMRRLFTLPELEGTYKRGFLGYEPIDGKYKAVCILGGNEIGILTLGALESWRVITNDSLEHSMIPNCGRCINGVMYIGFIMVPAIMSFDLRSEKFSLIHYPMDDGIGCYSWESYEGRLALATSTVSLVRLWILEDAENLKWICKEFPSPPPPYNFLDWGGVTDAGEFIYTYTPKMYL